MTFTAKAPCCMMEISGKNIKQVQERIEKHMNNCVIHAYYRGYNDALGYEQERNITFTVVNPVRAVK